jgi:hypothetical protein
MKITLLRFQIKKNLVPEAFAGPSGSNTHPKQEPPFPVPSQDARTLQLLAIALQLLFFHGYRGLRPSGCPFYRLRGVMVMLSERIGKIHQSDHAPMSLA